MKKLILFTILPLLLSCQNSGFKYSDKETLQFLESISKNAKVSITDITEIKKQPTDEFEIITRYPSPKKRLEEYRKNNATLTNRDDDISDFATYTIKEYKLTNEKDEDLKLVDNGRANYLQEYPLWENNHILDQNIGIPLKLNKKFEKLTGLITIEFEMPNKTKKEKQIPVNISVYDKIQE